MRAKISNVRAGAQLAAQHSMLLQSASLACLGLFNLNSLAGTFEPIGRPLLERHLGRGVASWSDAELPADGAALSAALWAFACAERAGSVYALPRLLPRQLDALTLSDIDDTVARTAGLSASLRPSASSLALAALLRTEHKASSSATTDGSAAIAELLATSSSRYSRESRRRLNSARASWLKRTSSAFLLAFSTAFCSTMLRSPFAADLQCDTIDLPVAAFTPLLAAFAPAHASPTPTNSAMTALGATGLIPPWSLLSTSL